MIEAFYSGKAGLKASQNALDVLSNNVANVNTTSYKAKEANFGSLLSISEADPATSGSANLLAGSGSAVESVKTDMTVGSPSLTGQATDYAINSENGFFAVKDSAGKLYYTRDGHFQFVATANGLALETSDGMAVLDGTGNAIGIGTAGGTAAEPGVFAFGNTDGLLSAGGNLFVSTNASGNAAAVNTAPVQDELEQSNVDLATEMVGMITVQRGYQFNSGVVSTASQIESMINEIPQS
jgi:fagellar hook-basal body proteins